MLMNAIELLQQGFDNLHEAIREDMSDVDGDWLFAQPTPGVNHIGFLFWHLVRDEDTVISYATEQPQLWDAGGWHELFGMDGREQGTGLSPEAAGTLRYDLLLFREYAEAAWARTRPSLERLTEDDLDRVRGGVEWNTGRLLVEGCLGHSWLHLGEIRSIMGPRGWRFRE
jgi:hypothetical protein